MIEIDNVHKSFGELEVIKGVSLQVKKGEVVSIIGGSGSGKSTLLMCINGLESIKSGSIRVDGRTMILVTHEIRFARDVSDRVAFFRNGLVHEIGTPDQVIGNPQRPETADFLKSIN